jgi:hypothetical protein
MARGLTKKEKGFVKDIVNGKTQVQAGLDNYDTTDYMTASAIASENLNKPKIQRAIADRLPDDLLEEKHLALLNKTEKKFDSEGEIISEEIDVQAVSKGLDMAYKVKGSYAPEKQDINIKQEQTPEQINRAIEFEKWYKNNQASTT